MAVILILAVIVASAAGVLIWLLYSLRKHEVSSSGTTATPVEPIAPIEKDNSGVPLEVSRNEDVEKQQELLLQENEVILQLKEEVRNTREKAVVQAKNAIEVINKLRDENEAFKVKILEGNCQIEKLSRELVVVQQSLAEKSAIQSVQAESSSAHLFLNVEAAEALKEDIESLNQAKSKFEARIEELEFDARTAKEKNDLLQYELTKSRAQAIGVERIYDNARKKLEGIARDAHDTEQDNIVLKKQANILEKGLTDFKRLNSELLKKEKLNQYELENNRIQISDLERIYKAFRERLESVVE